MADDETMRDRLLQTFELFEFGVEMMAANLRRKHPKASPAAIEEMLEHWLAAEPAASDGESFDRQGSRLLSP
jgi:Rv0078B-related antitoxin